MTDNEDRAFGKWHRLVLLADDCSIRKIGILAFHNYTRDVVRKKAQATYKSQGIIDITGGVCNGNQKLYRR